MGDFVASYTRSDGPDGGASAQRTRQGYLHLHGNENGMAAASVPRSVVTARWLAQGRHVHELSAEERVILRVAGNTVADVKTSVSLASRDVSGALGGFWTSEFRAEDFVFSPADRLAKEPPDPRFANRAPHPWPRPEDHGATCSRRSRPSWPRSPRSTTTGR
jgi:hypothetical protein